MKKARLFISAAVVFAVVGSALAFKPVNTGTTYCSKNAITGACENRIDYALDNVNGTTTEPCGSGVQEYTIVSSVCTASQSTDKFKSVAF